MNHVGYVWTILRKIFPGDITLQVKGMKQFSNGEGCAFDIPEELSEHFEETLKKDKFYGANFTCRVMSPGKILRRIVQT